VDDIMDKYLRPDYDHINRKRPRQEEVPNFIDLEGNEENVSKKGGNQPDRTMRPDNDVPILHSINSLSRRMVDSVMEEPESHDGDTDDEYIAQLRLGDLAPERSDDHVSLNISNRENVDFGSPRSETTRATMDPKEALRRVQETMKNNHIDLLEVDQDTSSLSSAARQITSDIKAHAKTSSTEDTDDQNGLPDSVLSQLHLTHSSSVEFLRQFWLTYLSTARSSAKKKELESLAQSLKRTQDRMEAVRLHAVTEGGETMGARVTELLAGISSSVQKAIRLWERGS